MCPICEREEETIEHTLLLCEWVRSVWFGIIFGCRYDVKNVSSFDRWYTRVVKSG